jgi:hypothetical protein
MLAAAERFEEVALELAPAIGLPDQIAERDNVTTQMLLDVGSEDSAGRRALHGSSPSDQLPPTDASQSDTSTSPEGCDMSPLFQGRGAFASADQL